MFFFETQCSFANSSDITKFHGAVLTVFRLVLLLW